MREFDSEQQMKQTVCCQSYTVPIYLEGKGANSSAGFEGETCSSPVIRIRNGRSQGRRLHLEVAIEKTERRAGCATRRKQAAFKTLSAVMSELGILMDVQSNQIQDEKERERKASLGICWQNRILMWSSSKYSSC